MTTGLVGHVAGLGDHEHWIAHAVGRPMLSFVRSDLSAAELASAMQRFIEVQTEDGQAFLLRWADTRVAVRLAEALSELHWSALRLQLADWQVIDRFGALVKLPGSSGSQPLAGGAGQGTLKLSDAELNALLRISGHRSRPFQTNVAGVSVGS